MPAKHDEFDDFFSDDDAPVTDTRADGRLYRVPLGRLSPNLVNPRTSFGTQGELIDLGKSLARRQNQACPVVSRSAYLKLWPDHAKQIGDVDYVLVSGERRFRSAHEVGLPALNCVADDGAAIDRKTFMEAVVSENVDRSNFNAVEEAYAVQALVREFGSNRAVAQHFERADGWVTQRILLTHLAPQMQELVRDKAMPLEVARSLGKLARDSKWDAADQAAWWEEHSRARQAASAARKEEKREAKRVPAQPSTPHPSFTAVKQEPASPVAGATHPAAVQHRTPSSDERSGAGAEPESAPLASPVTLAAPVDIGERPAPEQKAPTGGRPTTLPPLPPIVTVDNVEFGRPESVAKLLLERMTPDNFRSLVKALVEHLD